MVAPSCEAISGQLQHGLGQILHSALPERRLQSSLGHLQQVLHCSLTVCGQQEPACTQTPHFTTLLLPLADKLHTPLHTLLETLTSFGFCRCPSITADGVHALSCTRP